MLLLIIKEGGKGRGGGVDHISQREKMQYHNSRVLKKQRHILYTLQFVYRSMSRSFR